MCLGRYLGFGKLRTVLGVVTYLYTVPDRSDMCNIGQTCICPRTDI